MNVMINDISDDLDTTVEGVQATITAMLLIMAPRNLPRTHARNIFPAFNLLPDPGWCGHPRPW